MTTTNKGYLLFVAALGMMAGLMSADIVGLEAWESATSPAFLGKMLAHLAAVIAAFVAGKIIPTEK